MVTCLERSKSASTRTKVKPATAEKVPSPFLDRRPDEFFARQLVQRGTRGYDPNLYSGTQGAMYYPLVDWARLQDTADVAPAYLAKVKDAYELGLMRSEAGIARGRMVNGRLLEPKGIVTRAKAAKALYFMWVLTQAPKAENDN